MVDNPTHSDAVTTDTGHIERVVRDLYIAGRHTDQEIADALGVNRVTVTKWRKRWGITRDDRPAVAL